MNLLVTGGAGFIGCNFIRYMLQKYPDYHIINLDALTYAGHLNNLAELESHPNYTFIKGNIKDTQCVDTIFEQHISAVINFAAESHVDRSIRQPHVFIESNIVGAHVLLQAALQHGVQRFVQISTDEVYGSLGETGLFTELTPLAPNSPYSASKASADLLARAYFETYDLPVVITRCSNNYGPYQFPEKLIPHMIAKAIKDQPLPIYGDGMNVRDWLHVEDHCRAIDLVLHHATSGEIYNVGGNNERTNNEIVRIILEKLSKPDSLISYVEDRRGHDRRYGIDATKIRNELGWRPRIMIEQGLSDTIDWYLNNSAWLEQ